MGEIPEDWQVKRLDAIFLNQNSRNKVLGVDSYLSLMANVGVIPYAEKGAVGNRAPIEFDKCKLVSQGDFVLNTMNFGIGSFGVSAYDGMVSPVYFVLRPLRAKETLRYYRHLFNTTGFRLFSQMLGSGILEHRAAIPWDEFKTIGLPVPCDEEQAAIASYLDQETSRIDTLISKKEQLIEKLLERRQALITQVVTKGLDPNVPMKDSGVEWLGEVPEGWSVQPLWTILTFSTGWTPPSKDDANFGGEHPWVNISDMGKKEIRETQKTLSDQGVRLVGRHPVATGSLLFSFKLSVGQVSFAGCELFTNEAIASFSESPSQQVLLDFAFYMLPVAVPENCSWNIYGARMLNESRIRQARIIVPPTTEQAKIAAYLDKEISQIDSLVEKTRKAIDLLKERRQALITQVVTGKIDVRGFAGGNS